MCAQITSKPEANDRYSIRVFVKDKDLGFPISELPLSMKSETGKNFGILVTDVYGYVSFKPCVSDLEGFKELIIAPVGQEKFETRILIDDIRNGQEIFSVELERGKLDGVGSLPGVPSYQDPDKFDYQVAKDLLASRPVITNGNFDCTRPIPNPDSTVEFDIKQLAFLEDELPTGLSPGGFGTIPDCVPSDLIQREQTFMKGKLIDYRVGWTFMGHSMGELLNSFSLAPCETVNIATIDWTRTERAIREDALVATESIAYESRRDRMIQETMNGLIKDRSFGANLGFGYGVGSTSTTSQNTQGELVDGGTGNDTNTSVDSKGFFIGGTIGVSTSSRDLSLRTQQALRDTVRTQASSVRQEHRVAVVNATQSENQVVQTRNITNHNKCHTLNLMYYEVLRHYEVSSQAVAERDVLLLHHCIEELTPADVVGKKHILRKNLLCPELAECFDPLARLTFCDDPNAAASAGTGTSTGNTQQNTVTETRDVSVSKINVEVKIGNNGTDGLLYFVIPGTTIRQLIPGESSGQNYKKNETYQVSFNVSDPLLARDIFQVQIDNEKDSGFDGAVKLRSLKVTYNSPEVSGTHGLYNKTFDVKINGDKSWFDSASAAVKTYDIEVPAQDITNVDDVVDNIVNPDSSVADKCCADQLMAHINENLSYYSAILWMNESPVERAIRFSQFDYNGKPLITQILNEPLGVIGNYVAFELNNVDPTPILPPVNPTVETVILPTRGVFAESLLGECSSCETVEDETGTVSEYRDFDCSCSAPAIAVEAATPTANNNLSGIAPNDGSASAINIQTSGGDSASLLSGLSALFATGGGGAQDLDKLGSFLTAFAGAIKQEAAKAKEEPKKEG